MMSRISHVVFSMLGGLVFSAHSLAAPCDIHGFTEKIIRPAELEYGQITHSLYKAPNTTQERTYPAVTKKMSMHEYKILPSTTSYKQPYYVDAEVQSTPINLVDLGIAEYDLVYHVNGAVTERPLANSPQEEIYNEYLIKPVELKEVLVTIERPKPKMLPNGEVLAVIRPAVSFPVLFTGPVVTVNRRYLKKRTPAVIHKVPCTLKEE